MAGIQSVGLNYGINQYNNGSKQLSSVSGLNSGQLNQNTGGGRYEMPKGQGQASTARDIFVGSEDRLSTLEAAFDEKTLKKMGVVECTTCSTRTYQDGSDDASVSFQSPTHISPEQSAGAVMNHEMEHVVNEKLDAEREDRQVVSQSVQIFHSVCPECGKSYVSGGLTTTTTAGKSNPYENVMQGSKAEAMIGNLVDIES